MTDRQTLLIVEDDFALAGSLKRSFERRGYGVTVANDAGDIAAVLADLRPSHAIVDLKLGSSSGLEVVAHLQAYDQAIRIVVLTGFASIATAVEAIKLGACHYLAKPANAVAIEAAFERTGGDANVALGTRPTSIKTLEWERIHEVLAESDFNITEAARRLGLHRRTLARKLAKQRVSP